MKICEKKECCGCFACVNICPQQCIEMKEDELGYIYPQINNDKCINCGKCRQVCPSQNTVASNTVKKCYAGINKNEKEYLASTSGGIAYAISKKILSLGGLVYGAVVERQYKTKHIRIENEKELYRTQGSKYVISYLDRVFTEIKKELMVGRQVLFTGTPCQVAGLKLFLGKEYENLITLDIVCHGVPSYLFLKQYIEEIGGHGDKYSFRKGKDYYFQLFDNNELSKEVFYRESEYIMGFLTNITQRDNCFSCKYASLERYSDITVGDFWGIDEETASYLKAQKGSSVLLINSEKGERVFQLIDKDICYIEQAVEMIKTNNTQLTEPPKEHIKRAKFKKMFLKYGFCKSIRKVLFLDFTRYKIKKIIHIRKTYSSHNNIV